MMQNLKLSGMLENLAGMLVGGLTDMHDNEVPFGMEAAEIIRAAVDEFDFPVCLDFPAGHIRENMALILGKQVSLEVTRKGSKLNYID